MNDELPTAGISKTMQKILELLVVACLVLAFPAKADPARLAQLVDYVGVDYAVAVKDGQVISDAEYGEMVEFAGLIEDQVQSLPAGDVHDALHPLAEDLRAAIDDKADPRRVASIASRMTGILLSSPDVVTAPATPPDPEAARALYAEHCAACHGAEGRGDGPAVNAAMEPTPTDFTEIARARARSLYGLFNTITLGVEGTSMPSFSQLSPEQRWSLAFYVGGLHVDAETRRRGEESFASMPPGELPDLRSLSTSTPAGVADAQGPAAASLYSWLRVHPEALATARPDPLTTSIVGIRRSLDLYAAGNAAAAHDAAVDAYLEGFELAEAALRTTRPALVTQVESGMTDLRQAIRKELPDADVRAAGDRVLELLEAARNLQNESLSPWVAFVSAMIILLREGMEAILVLGAMAAFLNKTDRRDALKWFHGGWVAALGVGVMTWFVSNYFFTISGATREMTEGITAMIAAGVLFYVGFWMHSKLNARRWQVFIQDSVRRALDQRGLWTLAGIAFVAVYREVFEVVLFFQALWAQVTVPAAQSALLAGMAAGAVGIVAVAWIIFRFGVRLPLRQFFGATAGLMIVLAVIFAGKGVAALQEAGRLPLDPVAFPRIELLGIYPTLQSLGVQLVVLAAAVAVLVYNSRPPRMSSGP